jgi:S1-C subfamily serine protease
MGFGGGNPYNLTSTVTAGIVSAKAEILAQEFNLYSNRCSGKSRKQWRCFSKRGDLIGINTMISSMTGSYVGYSFAVPSNIARKIIEDLMEYGNVQRAILGVEGGE